MMIDSAEIHDQTERFLAGVRVAINHLQALERTPVEYQPLMTPIILESLGLALMVDHDVSEVTVVGDEDVSCFSPLLARLEVNIHELIETFERISNAYPVSYQHFIHEIFSRELPVLLIAAVDDAREVGR